MHLTTIERFRKRTAHMIAVKPQIVRLERGVLTICFDDFPKNAWSIGGAVLSDHGVRASYFVSGSLCNTRADGIEYFDERDLQDVWSAKNEVGCHTFDHVSALKVSAQGYQNSILKNAKYLKNVLGCENIRSFAYPYNHTSVFAKIFTRRQFQLARGVGTRANGKFTDLSELSAINLSRSSIAAFPMKGRCFHDIGYLVDRAATQKEWLIVYTHDVSDKPSEHGCRSAGLNELIIRAKSAGLDIKPMKDVAPLLCL
ncbi:polysaccharide deacetylase family protein [Microvirga sp. BT689]|uniref:polysaccharide deacetylase family protein n=1 Tax=Microvirga arvi TaxID=2778731 RepID=UPI001950136E|nr:polysaccharide deacetylase family protein [Microvirga arvi]MBM6584148.1 polysaccharide deacetylase family protein [Microvirga arvi]